MRTEAAWVLTAGRSSLLWGSLKYKIKDNKKIKETKKKALTLLNALGAEGAHGMLSFIVWLFVHVLFINSLLCLFNFALFYSCMFCFIVLKVFYMSFYSQFVTLFNFGNKNPKVEHQCRVVHLYQEKGIRGQLQWQTSAIHCLQAERGEDRFGARTTSRHDGVSLPGERRPFPSARQRRRWASGTQRSTQLQSTHNMAMAEKCLFMQPASAYLSAVMRTWT